MSSSFIGPVPKDKTAEEAQNRSRQASSGSPPASSSHETGYSGPAAYLATQQTGLRRRIVRPQPQSTQPAPPPAATPPAPTSVAQRLDQIGSASGYLGTGASVAEALHPNPLSEAIAHVPVLGAASSARTAVNKRQMSQQAYIKGDLSGVFRHGVGSVASGIKAASDAATVASGGLSAPITAPVSTVASLVNTATSLPEYAQSAASTYQNRDLMIGRGMTTVASLPATLSSVASSVSGYLGGGTPAPPTEQERQQAANARARALMPEKRYLGKLD